MNSNGELTAYLVDAGIEQAIESSVEHTEHTSNLNMAPQRIRDILDRIGRVVGSAETPVVALCGSGSRAFLRQIAESNYPNFVSLSHSEIPAGTRVLSLGTIH